MKTSSYSLILKRGSWLSGLLDLHVSITPPIHPWCDIGPNIFVSNALSVSMIKIINTFIMSPLVFNGFLDLWGVIPSYKLLFLVLLRPHELGIPPFKRYKDGLNQSAPRLLNTIFSRKTYTTWTRVVLQLELLKHRRLLLTNIFASVIKLSQVVRNGLRRLSVFVQMVHISLLFLFFERKISQQAGFPTIFPMTGGLVVIPRVGPAISTELNGCANVLSR